MSLSPRRKKRLIWAAVIAVALAGIAAAALVVTAQPEFCRTCHLMKTRYVSWERSDHYPQADCMDCHAEPGVWGEIKAHLNGTRYLYVLVTGVPQVVLRARVPDGTCVQCHPLEEIEDDAQGLDAAHVTHDSAGLSCETCHRGFHDEITGGSLEASREVCEECHVPSELPGLEVLDAGLDQRSWSVDGVR